MRSRPFTVPRRGAMLAGTMRIVAVDPILIDVPLREPVHGVHGTTAVQRGVLVRIETEAGAEGWGNVDPTPGSGLQLNVHFHTLVLDGAFSTARPGPLTFHPAVADRVCFFDGESSWSRGPPNRIFSNPSSERTKAFLRAVLDV